MSDRPPIDGIRADYGQRLEAVYQDTGVVQLCDYAIYLEREVERLTRVITDFKCHSLRDDAKINDAVEREVVLMRELTEAREQLASLNGHCLRFYDLIYHQRAELHEAGLITDEEYAKIVAENNGSVPRLETYDQLRDQLRQAAGIIELCKRDSEAWRIRLGDWEAERISLKADNANLTARLVEVEKERDRLQRECIIRRDQIAGAQNTIIETAESLGITRRECDSLRVQLKEAKADTKRMDWLEDFIQGGVVDTGFECDGGIYLTLSKPGDKEPAELREQNGLREALDEVIKRPTPSATAEEKP